MPQIPVEEVVKLSRVATMVELIKENQLLTAAALFILWQSGVLVSVLSEASGVMC